MKPFIKVVRRFLFYLIRLLRLKTGAKQISLGLVIGFLPCWFPTFGIGPALSIGLAKLVKGNIPAAIISASIGSFVFPFLFYFNYLMGGLVLFDRQAVDEILLDDVAYEEATDPSTSLVNIGNEFLLGSFINSFAFTIAGYFILKFIFLNYRPQLLSWLRARTPNRY